MGIMDVLEELNGPEFDEPTPQEKPEEAPEEPDSADAQAPAQTPDETVFVDVEEPDLPKPPRRPLRPELVMAVIAGLAAALVIVLLVLARPYFQKPDEDPEGLLHRHEDVPVTVPADTAPEAETPETEPTIPTIPPARNPYDQYDFQYNKHNYLVLQNVVSYPGVDVSSYQGDIDWAAVKASGIDFAIIRLGYRGYESGKLVEDPYAKKNLDGAAAAGLRVGAYFFSQALNKKEVDEEFAFMLDILGEQYLSMPLVLDWEIPAATARSAKMDARTLTDIQLHFCQKAADMGYQPMVYFNWHQSEKLYILHELEEYPFWLAFYEDRMTYPWDVEMWQYTSSGTVPGISGPVDINVYMPY